MSGLVLVSANTPGKIRNKRRAARILRGLGADVIGLQEGQGIFGRLPLRGYRMTYNPHGRDQRRGAKDTTILTRKSLPSIGAGSLQVSEEVQPERFAPDRWFTWDAVAHPTAGPIAVVNIHPNATVMSRDADAPIVREYAESVDSLDRLLTFLKGEGLPPFVTGDVNWRRKVRAPHSPYEVFHDHGLRIAVHNVDVVAYPRRQFELVEQERIAKARTGSDHDWLRATFRNR